MTIAHIIYVALGGAIGAVLRHSMSSLSQGASVPWGTLTANLLACFILGLVISKYTSAAATQPIYLLVVVGVCGGLSTFSTLIFEIHAYYTKASLAQGLLYLGGSIISGLLAFVIGTHSSKLF